jgi:hypothetical protein
MKTKEDLIATCQALRKNDASHTRLDLSRYDTLVDWKQEAKRVAEALENNVVVEDLDLSRHLCAESTFQLSHFLRSSPSLRRLRMIGKGQDKRHVNREIESLKTHIFIESISRNSSLVKLSLKDVVFGENCPLESFLASTRTLSDFTYCQAYSTMTHGTAQAIGRGFAKKQVIGKPTLGHTRWARVYGRSSLRFVQT